MVLNSNPLVADATRERVQRVIRELGYVYDRGAAQLRNKRTNIIGISICDLLNPYFAEIAARIEETVGESGRVLVLGNCGESVPRQSRFIHTLREYNAEGLLLMPAVGTSKSDIAPVLKAGVPLVQVSRYIPGVVTDYAGTDNRRGSALAAQHLLTLGHQRIGFVGLNNRTTTGRDRFAGFRAALVQAGQEPDASRVIECAPTREGGYHGIHSLFESRLSPTAVVCFNDLVAFGVMLGLRHLGVEPGRECSVVGADDVTEAALWQPPLTTVAVDVDGIGRVAGRLLRDRIEQPGRPVQRVLLEPRLIVRASCGRPPQSATPTPIRMRAA
jgi:LacI family transcriptional regulator